MIKIFLFASIFVAGFAYAEEAAVESAITAEAPTLCQQAIQTIAQIDESKFEVKVSETEAKAISEIVTTLGTTSLVGLGFKKGHLKALGAGLRGIGTLHFLGYIFSKEELRSHMKTIRKSSLKWDGFLDGLKPGFETAYKSKKLMEELDGFVTVLVESDSSK